MGSGTSLGAATRIHLAPTAGAERFAVCGGTDFALPPYPGQWPPAARGDLSLAGEPAQLLHGPEAPSRPNGALGNCQSRLHAGADLWLWLLLRRLADRQPSGPH